MENPTILSASSSGRRRSSASNSPEFEFWMVRNPSGPETTLHSADELFSGGFLLPLHHLNTQTADDPPDKHTTSDPPNIPTIANSDPGSRSGLTTTLTASKRWKDIFRKNPESKEKEKKKKKKDRNGGGGGGTSMAELNINLWPFSRSRSAGNAASRPRPAAAGNRKVSSAPCSRSNSAGESKSRKWPSSPNRGGVHLGRSSPVWQLKRVGSGRSSHDNPVRSTAEKGVQKKEGSDTRRSKKSTTGSESTVAGAGVGGKAKLLNVDVPTCIGYRHHLSCGSDEIQENKAVRIAGENTGVETPSGGVLPGGEGPRGSNLFNLRSLFTKKVY